MRRTAPLLLGLGLLAPGLLGCGDGGGGAACPAAPTCGGDLIGTWTVQSACFEIDPGFSGCTGVAGGGTAKGSGTITFNADGTYSRSDTATTSVRLPASCFPGLSSCANLGSSSTSPVDIGSCTGPATVACTCRLATRAEQGTYSTAANLVILMTGTNQGVTAEYCVDGEKLTLRVPSDVGFVEALTATRS